ncbi:MAG: hypothetical protein H7Z12_01515 [Rhodospirillaceae bacterium]|nr:hypothetical protein [Rhodospirillales bacterium]
MIAVLPPAIIAELRAMWRRRWLFLAVSWVLAVAGWVTVLALPNQYQAMTRIYVDTNTLLAPLLGNLAVSGDVQRQMEVMNRTLLNRQNIAQAARAADLDIGAGSDAELEALYDGLLKRILLKPEGRNLFTLTYINSDPVLAKRVIEEILNILIEGNIGRNRASMGNARTFIENQINEYEAKLQKTESKLAEFKSHNSSMLVATGSNFAAREEQVRQNLNGAKLRLEEAVIVRDQLRNHLAGVPQMLEMEGAPQIFVSGGAAPDANSRLHQLEASLAQMKSRYTDRHPDVVSARNELEQLRAEIAQAPASAAPKQAGGMRTRVPNAVYEQIKLRLVQAEGDVAKAEGQVRQAQEEVSRIAGLAETAPRIEAELSDLNREYGVIKAKYEELLGRRESARISEAVETSGDKVQFRIIEPPQVPSVPSWPNRPLFIAGVLAAALGAGVGLTFLLHKLDDTVGSAAQLVERFNVRVLGAVPKFENPARAQRRRASLRRFALASSGLVVCFVVAMALSVFATQLSSVLNVNKLMEKVRGHEG